MGQLFLKMKWRFPCLMLVVMMWTTMVWADTPKYPVVKNTTGKTIIQRISEDNRWLSDFMIISKAGTVVLVDPYWPRKFIDSVRPDLICVTHMQHPEHCDLGLIQEYMGNKRVKESLQKVESFTVKDVKVTGIASTHGIDEQINEQEPDNVIYVLEVDGLRIADFGGTCQAELTPGQMKKLGRIDIAFIEFVAFTTPQMSVDANIQMARQIGVQIIIPTHRNEKTVPELGEMMQLPVETVERVLVVSKADLKAGTKKIIELANPLD